MNYNSRSSILVTSLVFGALVFAVATFVDASGSKPRCGTTVTVQGSESLTSIAAKCGVSLSALKQANPSITDSSLLFPGEVINVPIVIPVIVSMSNTTHSPQNGSSGAPSSIPGSTNTTNGKTVYTVKRGDDLFAIASRYNVTLAAVEQANPQITDPKLIFPGQQIIIP